MVQENKEYQRTYFEGLGYKIFDNMENAIDIFCNSYPKFTRHMAKNSILDDTNCNFVVLNDGSVAVIPNVFNGGE